MATVFVVMLYRYEGTELYGVYGDIVAAAHDAAAMDIQENLRDSLDDPDRVAKAAAELNAFRAGPSTAEAVDLFLAKWYEDTKANKAELVRMLNNAAVVIEERRVVTSAEPGGVDAVREWRL